ncbi:FtsX-like permease family protein [Streptomyces sp. NPDC127098]|uniref:ABC transporter permease n=1 Tax=Streptomyces sp. NPDC127098 TaxID=3347137 RepID=UPI003656379F
MTVAAGPGAGRYTVVGLVAPAEGTLARQAALFFPDAEAERLNGTPGQVDAIGVLGEPGTDTGALADRLTAAVEGENATVATGGGVARAEFPDLGRARGDLTELAGTLGAAVVLITTLVVAGTLSLALHQRRRELAVLRAVAATPRQIAKLVAGEVAVVAAAAGLVGLLPGVLLARALRWALAAVGLIPGDLTFTVGPLPLVVAVAGCLAVAELAAWAAVRRTARLRPADALRDAAGAAEGQNAGRGRTVLGTVLLLLGTAASFLPLAFDTVFAVVGAGTGGLVMVIAVVLLGRSAVLATTRVLATPVRRHFGGPGHLAVAGALGDVRRLAAATAPLFLAIGFSCVQLFIPATMSAGAARDVDRGVLADHVLTGGRTGVPATVVDRVADLPAVRAVTRATTTTVYAVTDMLGDPEVFDYPALGVDPAGVDGTLDLGVRAGDLTELDDRGVALSRTAAGTLGAGVGDSVDLYLGDGTALRSRVVAVYDRGLGFGDVLLPHDTVVAHTTDHRTESLLVAARPDSAPDALRTALTELTRHHPGLLVSDASGYAAAQRSTFALVLFTSALPLILVYGYLALAVANTLVATVSGRARELALLRLAGATPRQVLRMFHAEAVLLVGGAVLVGTLVPLLPLVTIGYGLTGHPVPAMPPALYLAVTGTAAAVGTASLLVPARLALRADPIRAMGLPD